MMSFVQLLIGFVLLIWGADRFVDGASSVARRLGIPAVVVGLTIVAIGTSAPELSVSLTAALKGSNEIAVGNVIGSNFFNLLVVVGVSAAIAPMKADETILRRDLPMSGLAATALFAAIVFGKGTLYRGFGLALLAVLAVYLVWLVKDALRDHVRVDSAELTTPVWTIPLNLAVGLAGIIWGGDLTVDGACGIARMFGLSEELIAMTIVAVGTSLPELVTSITAARKGESGLALGNAVGSNIFNILMILGLSSAICPIQVSQAAYLDIAVLMLVTSLLTLFMRKRQGVTRSMGAVMTGVYIAYMAVLVMR